MPHKFKQFKQTLRKISDRIHDKNLSRIKKRLKEVKKALGEKSVKGM